MHNLRSAETLSIETGIDKDWLEAEAAAGRIPAKRIPTRDGGTGIYFHIDAVSNLIAIQAVNATAEPVVKEDRSNG